METNRLREALGYPKFRQPVPKVLIFLADYLMVTDVVASCEELGWQVETIATKTKGLADDQFVRELLTKILVTKPDFLLTINHFGFDTDGKLASLLDGFKIPAASWFIDHPLPILGGAPGNAVPHMAVFCFERTALSWLKRQGFEDPQFLPTGSCRSTFHPDKINAEKAGKLGQRVGFVGNSWWIKAMVQPPSFLKEAALKLGEKMIIDRYHLGDEFERKIKEILPGLKGDRSLYKAAGVAFAMASMKTRGQFASALQPLGLVVHGDPYWAELVPGMAVQPALDPVLDLPHFFAGTSINGNVTAEQMPTALNQRVWDVPGVRSFLITDAQDDALDFFEEDTDIVLYRDMEEAADKVKYYSNHPEQRDAIASKGFEKVESHHRISHRLQTMLAVMKFRFG